jgi:cell division protein FtsB
MTRRSSGSAKGKGYRSRNLNFNRNQGSGRVFAITAVFFALALFLAPPIKNYFTQRAQISALESQLSSDYAALDAAREELMLWKDPEYVKSQARERLHFVMPGERQYIVTGEEEDIDPSATTAKVLDGLPEGQPWYIRMIASISEAGKDER